MMHALKRILTALIVALAVIPWISQAAEPPVIQQQGELPGQDHGTYDGNPYFSGGIGVVDRENISKLIQDKYNLKLEFALKNGDYINQVKVRIKNEQGKTVMDATSVGPWFLTRLEPGTYQVWVSGFGREFQQTVTVPKKGIKNVVFNGWEHTT
jgi:hypothetical protein